MRTRLPRRVHSRTLVIALVALLFPFTRVPWRIISSILRQEFVTDALVLSLTSVSSQPSLPCS